MRSPNPQALPARRPACPDWRAGDWQKQTGPNPSAIGSSKLNRECEDQKIRDCFEVFAEIDAGHRPTAPLPPDSVVVSAADSVSCQGTATAPLPVSRSSCFDPRSAVH